MFWGRKQVTVQLPREDGGRRCGEGQGRDPLPEKGVASVTGTEAHPPRPSAPPPRLTTSSLPGPSASIGLGVPSRLHPPAVLWEGAPGGVRRGYSSGAAVRTQARQAQAGRAAGGHAAWLPCQGAGMGKAWEGLGLRGAPGCGPRQSSQRGPPVASPVPCHALSRPRPPGRRMAVAQELKQTLQVCGWWLPVQVASRGRLSGHLQHRPEMWTGRAPAAFRPICSPERAAGSRGPVQGRAP